MDDLKNDSENDLDMKLCSKTLMNFRPVIGSKLYRSARVDGASEEDVERMKQLGIKTIIDLRASNEFKSLGLKGVVKDKIKIKHSYIPHLVENTKSQSQGHTRVNYNENESKFNDASNSSENLRHRHYQEEKPVTNSSNKLKFAAINPESTNQNAASGRWVFLNLLNLKVLFLGALKTLPWYAIILAFLAIPIDAIFKTKLLLLVLGHFGSRSTGLDGAYCAIAEYSGPGISTALRVLLKPGSIPAVFCCRMGKDRTGVMSALVQRLCGVPREKIVKDYSLTEVYMKDIMESMKSDFSGIGADESYALSQPEMMENFLDWIDNTYGSIEGYLTSIGFTEKEQIHLKQVLS